MQTNAYADLRVLYDMCIFFYFFLNLAVIIIVNSNQVMVAFQALWKQQLATWKINIKWAIKTTQQHIHAIHGMHQVIKCVLRWHLKHRVGLSTMVLWFLFSITIVCSCCSEFTSFCETIIEYGMYHSLACFFCNLIYIANFPYNNNMAQIKSLQVFCQNKME